MRSLLYRAKPIVEMPMRRIRMKIPLMLIWGRVPPKAKPAATSIKPPIPRLYPVPTNTSSRLPNPRVISVAKAEQRAFRIIIPSPSHENCPLELLPVLRARIPAKPMMQPTILRIVILSLLKNMQARMTTEKTLKELSIAALEPSL